MIHLSTWLTNRELILILFEKLILSGTQNLKSHKTTTGISEIPDSCKYCINTAYKNQGRRGNCLGTRQVRRSGEVLSDLVDVRSFPQCWPDSCRSLRIRERSLTKCGFVYCFDIGYSVPLETTPHPHPVHTDSFRKNRRCPTPPSLKGKRQSLY